MRFLLRRFGFYAVALWGAITLNYLLPRLMPGEPIDGLLSRLSPSQLASNPNSVDNLRASLGFNKEPLFEGYFTYLGQILTGNFGISTSNFPSPVTEVIGRTLPYSIFLVGFAVIVAFLVGTSLGMIAAWRRGGVVDNVLTPALLAVGRVPGVLHVAARRLLPRARGRAGSRSSMRTTPTSSRGSTGPSSRARSGTRSCLTLVIITVFTGGWLLSMRNVMINTIEEDYVGMAHAKGLRDSRVMTMYAGRNAILPPLTGFAAQFGAAVGGLVFIEFVFSYPGVGLTLQQAALGSDYPLAQALLLVFAVCVLAANLIMDFLYVVLDPRVRAS